MAAPAEQSSTRYWQESQTHTGPRFASGYENSLLFWCITAVSKWINNLRHNLLHKPALTHDLCISYIYVYFVYNNVRNCVWCPYNINAFTWLPCECCYIRAELRRLFRKINYISRRRICPISTHVNGLGTNKNLVMSSDGDRNGDRLCWRELAAISSDGG
jgi:hypothetical protein